METSPLICSDLQVVEKKELDVKQINQWRQKEIMFYL